jgi:hypothetical protein
VRLLSRNRLPQSLPAIARAIGDLPVREVVLDGEVTWSGTDYHVFDVARGREALGARLPRGLGGGDRQAARLGLRAPAIPALAEDEVRGHAGARGGRLTDPLGKRVGLGALLVGYYERDDFVFAGKVGTGFDTRLVLSLRARLDRLEIPAPPFTRGRGLPRTRASPPASPSPASGQSVAKGFPDWLVREVLRRAALAVRDLLEEHPRSFTLRSMPARVDRAGDPWSDMGRRPCSLGRALERIT